MTQLKRKEEQKMRGLRKIVGCTVILMFSLWAGNAAGAGKVTVRALGTFTAQIQSTMIEQPFYKKLKEEASDRFDVQFRTMDELGQKGFDALRQLKGGIFDIMPIYANYIGGDDPYWQGMDLIGMAPDIKTAREVVEASRELLDQRLQKKFNGKILALWPYGTQVYFFKDKVTTLKDFQGKKIRIFGRAMADFIKYFGATGVTLPFPEVYMSLQKGVIDGAISGALAGNTASWFEVAKCLYMLPMGYSFQAHVVSLDFWKNLDSGDKDFLTKKFKQLDDDFWRYGDAATEDGINCNTGKDPCKWGQKGKMTVVFPSEGDKALWREAASKVVLPEWAKGCNRIDPNCTKDWNETAGKAINMKIPLN